MLFVVAMFAHANVCAYNWVAPFVGGSLSAIIAGLLYKIKDLKFELSQNEDEMEVVLTALLIKSADSVRSGGDGDKVVMMPGSDRKMSVPAQNWKRAEALARSVAAKSHNPKDPTGVKECPQATSRLEKLLERYQVKQAALPGGKPKDFDKKQLWKKSSVAS